MRKKETDEGEGAAELYVIFSLSTSKCGHLHTRFPPMANTIVFKMAYYFSMSEGQEDAATTEDKPV